MMDMLSYCLQELSESLYTSVMEQLQNIITEFQAETIVSDDLVFGETQTS